MRLLIVSDAWEPQINGVVRTYQHITAELRDMGHHVDVIGPDRFTSMPMPGYAEIRLSLFAAHKLTKLIDAFAPDAIHIAVEGPLGLAARRYCLRRNKPFTTSFHTQFPDYMAARVQFFGQAVMRLVRRAAIAFVRYFHAPAQCIFVATPTLEDQLRDWGFKMPMVRLLRGVNFDIFYPDAPRLMTEHPKPVQLYVGRVSIEKNIEAFLELPTPGTKIIVGGGPALESLKRKYPHAIFAGVQQGEELAAHFRSADVFVFPSKSDTFGIVLIEALACGLPVAGYDVMGPRDILTEPFLGAVDDDLLAAVQCALAAPGTPRERSAYAQSLYSWRAVAETFLECAQNKKS